MLAVGRREEGARQGSFHLVRLSDEAALVALSLFQTKATISMQCLPEEDRGLRFYHSRRGSGFRRTEPPPQPPSLADRLRATSTSNERQLQGPEKRVKGLKRKRSDSKAKGTKEKARLTSKIVWVPSINNAGPTILSPTSS